MEKDRYYRLYVEIRNDPGTLNYQRLAIEGSDEFFSSLSTVIPDTLLVQPRAIFTITAPHPDFLPQPELPELGTGYIMPPTK